MPGPLEGIKVLDISQGAAGPTAAMMLAEMGAETIKVEPPWGDWTRIAEPRKNGVPLMGLVFNTHKKSVILDMRREGDREVMDAFVKWADVFVENFKPGVADRMGLGYERLSSLNPRIIYYSASAYGHRGPLTPKGGFDPVGQALGGLWSISGQPGGRAVRPWFIIPDHATGAYCMGAILLALYHREHTGRGQKIESSLFQSSVGIQQTRAAEHFATGHQPELMGSATPHIVPSQAFATQDRWLAVEVPKEDIWPPFCLVLGLEELVDDPRFTSNAMRVEHREALVPLLEARFKEKPAALWLEILQSRGVPCAIVVENLDEIYADRQVVANRLLLEVEHRTAGTLKLTNLPWKFGETPLAPRVLGPELGQHTQEVLDAFGLSVEPTPEADEARQQWAAARTR